MFGVLCGRPRLWQLLPYAHGTAAAPFDRLLRNPLHTLAAAADGRDFFSRFPPVRSDGAASVWHTILPSYWRRKRPAVFGRHESDAVKHGEGSWNVAWDARPARWLHRPDSAWLLFGVSAGALQVDTDTDIDLDSDSEVLVARDESKTDNYRVTGVKADGRCLFRAIAHMACLRKGEEAPDEVRQKDLADELRAQVVEELLKRRKEVEWFIDEEFDMYVKRIEQPYIWGGEPELLMCSHVLRSPIRVFMKDKGSKNLIKVANYGDEYRKEKENFINVLFYGYGHYDVLEVILEVKK
ncbi:uncharacterized protein LOC131006239 [Salvia miltiorrhiza]|uniref:uncharacterized protein LOC131006239 n=1 Tax=Salvia miltiorrhiza TaxID=226208 RepID=UPI0025AD632E|nr:uncharacterized protein LOC131006239 [Salvia miltiorrhiza]